VAQGKVTLRRARTALNEIIEAVVQVVQPSVQERHQQLVVDLPADALWLEAHAARLQQVFSNLLTNAVKFTPAGGRIDVFAETQYGRVIVRVRDTGAGLSADALPHIFELFAQATADGLGLLSRLGPIGWSLDPHAAPPMTMGQGVAVAGAGNHQGCRELQMAPSGL
jgi:signal transduction histidine kinase